MKPDEEKKGAARRRGEETASGPGIPSKILKNFWKRVH